MADLVGMRAIEIGENDDSELVVHIAGDVGVETLPGSAMFNQAMAANVGDKPGETVAIRIWFAIVQLHRRPHLVQAGALEKLFRVKGRIPFRQIKDVEVEAAVRSGVDHGRNTFLVLQLTLYEAIPGGPVGNDVGLIDDARIHPQWLKNSIVEKISVEL